MPTEQKQAPKRARETEEPAEPKHVETEIDEEALSDLLDEIDDVLEENAEAFVQNYVQKGGE